MNLITLFLTCATKQEAEKITNKLIDKKLAACVRQMDVSSTYWWKGKKENNTEVMIIIESEDSKFDDIETTVRQQHSYETFVLSAYPVLKTSAGVERWMQESLR